MTDRHDERGRAPSNQPDELLTRLRAADPAADLPDLDPASPEARALEEEIRMSATATTRPATAPVGPRWRRPRWLAAAAVLVAVIAVAAGLAIGADGDDEPREAVAPSTTAPGATDPGITPGGGLSAMCVEIYSLDTLAAREVAFAGTVTAVAGDQVTFAVDEWYRGPGGDEITLGGAEAFGAGLTSVSDGAVSLEPGTRLLVAGDGGFAWSCGFTQPYDAAVAAQWAEVLG